MDVRFQWEARALAALHRQRTRRTMWLQSISMPALATIALAWLSMQAGSPAALWAHARGPALGLLLLAVGWPLHMQLLHAWQASKAGQAGCGPWRLGLDGGCFTVRHLELQVRVPCSGVRLAAAVRGGIVLALPELEVAVPAASAGPVLDGLAMQRRA